MSKVAVITGASRGIGKAIALKFVQNGYDLALSARNGELLERVKNELSDYGQKVVTLSCDVSKLEETKAFAKFITEHFQQVDVLVNNAGTFLPGELIHEPDGVLEAMIETNLYSSYYITRAVLPFMMPNKAGHIFNLGSVAGIKEYPNGGAYSISKFAINGFSKGLRAELKPHGIAVTQLIPGATYTDSWAASGLPESRFMKVEDIADMVWAITNLSENTVVEEILLRPILGDI